MRSSYSSLLLLACGAIYAFFNPGGPSGGGQRNGADTGPASTTVVEAAPGAEKDADTDDESTYPRELCRQFAACASAKAPETGLRPTELRDDIQEPRFIIATVPDPASTHLRMEFDRAIDGIKDAAADEEYLFRRYWFPWPLQRPAQFSDRASQQAEERQRAAKRRLPGFLLFENSEHKTLIVLLVGESPTDGVDRRQFDRAIKLKQEIEELAKAQDNSYARDDRLHILGTSFSGSLYTLQLALTEKPAHADFDAVSGTVADKESIRSFNQSIQRYNAQHLCRGCTQSRLRTLRHDSVTALKAFRDYLHNTWHEADKIAILSETDTVFGALQGLSQDKDFFLIPFPRDIAHLRNAYQSYPELSALGATNPDLQQQKNLPLPLDDSRNTINSIPDFAAQTVVSQETLVSQIANRIRHEHIRFAGIIGSDVLDVLFVTRFMRAASPDTRLFLIEPDLLFVHAADALPFEGVLAVTTYPLLEGNPPFDQAKSDPSERHWMFPTPFQQGIHNAMRVLLADMMRKQVPPLPGYDIVEPGDREPALWITSVGRESFVPIAVIRNPSELDQSHTRQASMPPPMPGTGAAASRTSPSEPALVRIPDNTDPLAPPGQQVASRAPREPTRIWWILFLMVTLAMVVLALILHAAQNSDAAWLNDFRIQGRTGYRRQLSVFLVFAAGIYLLVLSTGLRALVRHPVSYPVPFFLALIGLSAVGCLAWLWLRHIKLRASSQLAIGLVAASVTAVIALFVSLSFQPANLRGVLFSFRSFEVSAGAAPTVPFLFLFCGFLVCSFVNLERHIFHHQRIQFIPRAACDPTLGKSVWQGARRLRRQFEKPPRRTRRSSALLAAGAFLLCYWGLHESGIRSFEGIWYDRLFTIWASALAAALVVAGWRFLESWRRLDSILGQLETHPLRRALSALPADYSWSPIWQSNPRKRSYLILTRSVDALAALGATGLCSPELERLIANAKHLVAVILDRVAEGKRETAAEYFAAQSALAETADNLVRELQPVWEQGSSEILDESKDARTKHDDERPPLVFAVEFVAMRYLAFIRYVMLQLRNMLTFLTLGFLAFAFALMSYPFEGERLIAWVITLLFVGLSTGIVVVLAQMETDATLSRITNRDAGKLGFAFFHRALAFGALPLLTVLASNFNGVGRFLFSWIEPTLKTLH